jgi:hypothetical protein
LTGASECTDYIGGIGEVGGDVELGGGTVGFEEGARGDGDAVAFRGEEVGDGDLEKLVDEMLYVFKERGAGESRETRNISCRI